MFTLLKPMRKNKKYASLQKMEGRFPCHSLSPSSSAHKQGQKGCPSGSFETEKCASHQDNCCKLIATFGIACAAPT